MVIDMDWSGLKWPGDVPALDLVISDTKVSRFGEWLITQLKNGLLPQRRFAGTVDGRNCYIFVRPHRLDRFPLIGEEIRDFFALQSYGDLFFADEDEALLLLSDDDLANYLSNRMGRHHAVVFRIEIQRLQAKRIQVVGHVRDYPGLVEMLVPLRERISQRWRIEPVTGDEPGHVEQGGNENDSATRMAHNTPRVPKRGAKPFLKWQATWRKIRNQVELGNTNARDLGGWLAKHDDQLHWSEDTLNDIIHAGLAHLLD
jgi:hypothetical protein